MRLPATECFENRHILFEEILKQKKKCTSAETSYPMRRLAVFYSNIHGRKRKQNRLVNAAETQKIKAREFSVNGKPLKALGFQGLYWWGLAGSNRRPPACEAGTLTS